MACDSMRMKPREKQFALLLAVGSFAIGKPSGNLDRVALRKKKRGYGERDSFWERVLCDWKPAEIQKMFENFRKENWISIDVEAGIYTIQPSNLPGWKSITVLRKEYQLWLRFEKEPDLNNVLEIVRLIESVQLAKISPILSCLNR